jgi:hypothetical protein
MVGKPVGDSLNGRYRSAASPCSGGFAGKRRYGVGSHGFLRDGHRSPGS